MKGAVIVVGLAIAACSAEGPISIGSAAATTDASGAGGNPAAAGGSSGAAGVGGSIAGSAGSAIAGAAGAPNACPLYAAPSAPSTCTSCDADDGNCQKNGCFNGYWCNEDSDACLSPELIGACATGGIPTRCGGTNHDVGCCAPDGNTYFCDDDDDADAVETNVCKSGTCGWNAAQGRYGCNTDGGTDPTGTYPKACISP